MARDYEKEYKDYHSTPEQKKKRAQRNAARRDAQRKGKVKKGDNKDVHHVKPIRKGGENEDNTRVTSSRKNKGWRKGKKGYD